jgi:hypothetical protein
MTRIAYNALKESIEHWRRLSEGERFPNEFIGSEHCALCVKFLNVGHGCEGCPVSMAKKMPCCHCTPYQQIATFISSNNISARGYALYEHPEFLKLAKLELSFLERLLPLEAEVEEEEEEQEVDLGF